MSRSELGSKVHQWAVEEMHFIPRDQCQTANSNFPTVDDLQKLCRGQGGDALRYVINHVFSTQNVRKVKGNIHIREKQALRGSKHLQLDKDEADEKTLLLEKHSDLSYKLTNNLTSIGHIEKELSRIRNEILITEQSYQETLQGLNDLHRKTALLKAYSQDIDNTVKTYGEYSSRIEHKATALKLRSRKADEKSIVSASDKSINKNEIVGFETYCTKNVRETCQVIGSFLDQMLSGKFTDNAELLSARKDMLWKRFETVWREYAPKNQVHGLCIASQQSTAELMDKAKKVDISQDAEKLRFKYESGSLTDLSVPPSGLQTVQELLEGAHQTNVDKFVKVEKSKNHCRKLEEQLKKAKQPVINHFERSYRGDPTALELAKTLFNLECQIAASRSNIKELETASERLKDEISDSVRQKNILIAKYKKIQNFKKLVDNKQNLIKVLVKQNINAKNKLEVQGHKITDYIHQIISSHKPEIKVYTSKLKDSISSEVDQFAKVHLPYLMFTVLSGSWKVAVIDLSINRLKGEQINSNVVRTLRMIMDLVDFPAFKAPELLLEQIIIMKEQTEELNEHLKLDLHNKTVEHNRIVEKMEELSKTVNTHMAAQLETLLPPLQKRLANATQALTECLNLKDLAQLWWDQPGQFVTPWIEIDGDSYQSWYDKWTVLVTQLRQVHLRNT